MRDMQVQGREIGELTLLEVSQAGGLAFECERCRHVAQIDLIACLGRHWPETRVSELQRKAHCRRCDKRSPLVLLQLKGVRGDRAWIPHPPHARR